MFVYILLTKSSSLVGSVALKKSFLMFAILNTCFWESKHKGKDFVKSTKIKNLFYFIFMYKKILHIFVANDENWGSPQISHKQHYYKLPQQSWSWVVTLRVLGRFLICQRYLNIPLNFSSCLSCSLVAVLAVRLSPGLFTSKPWWFTTGCELYILRATMWLQFEESCYNWNSLVESVCVAFSNFSRVSCFLAEPIRNKFVFSDSKVRMICHMLVSSTH